MKRLILIAALFATPALAQSEITYSDFLELQKKFHLCQQHRLPDYSFEKDWQQICPDIVSQYDAANRAAKDKRDMREFERAK